MFSVRSSSATGLVMNPPPPFEPITIHNVKSQIGLVQDFFLAKLHANDDEPLVEDEDLPIKQRFPKPRLPPTGKITSPRKRPPREAQQIARKKRKLEDGKEEAPGGPTVATSGNGPARGVPKAVGKLRFDMPNSRDAMPDPEKHDGSVAAMMSPESIT
jgi:transcriptional activator SPT7